MKKVILKILTITFLCSFALPAGKDKQTFVEKVAANKPVKVFFTFQKEMIDKDHERKLKQADKKAKTNIRTALPPSFYDSEVKNEILKRLNEGLEMQGAFVEADLASVPKKKNAKARGLDLSGLDDGLYAVFDVEGEYTRFMTRKEVEGKTVFNWKNSLQIMSKLFFYEVINHKVKSYGSSIILGLVNTPSKSSSKMEDLAYMERNCPASSLLEEYKRESYSNIDDFTKRKMKKHNKAISKRK